MNSTTHVLLLTRDAALRNAAWQSRPAGAVLQVVGPEAACECAKAGHCWVDLDCVSELPAAEFGRIVYFGRAGTGVPPRLPSGTFMPKPALPLNLNILWADAFARRSTPIVPALPAWVTDLVDLDAATLRRALVEEFPARLGYQLARLYLRSPDLDGWILSESTPADVATSARAAAVDEEFLLKHWTARAPAARTPDHGAPPASLRLAVREPNVAFLALPGGPRDCALRLETSTPQSAVSGEQLEALARFVARVLANANRLEQARNEARRDGLTGLFNYRGIHELLRAEARRAERFKTALSVLMIDIDGLKALNDLLGHATGDAALKAAAASLQSTLREFDRAGRIGGDEFLAILPATDVHGAATVAQRLLQSLNRIEFGDPDNPLPVTASIGAAQLTPGSGTDDLIVAADQALYTAKRAGKARVELSQNAQQTEPVASSS